MFNILAIYCFIYSLWISAIAFFTIFARYMIIGEGTSSSVIRGYTLNTSKMGTRLSRLVISLKALNIICRIISLLILGNLITII
jgi:hypothetical protein